MKAALYQDATDSETMLCMEKMQDAIEANARANEADAVRWLDTEQSGCTSADRWSCFANKTFRDHSRMMGSGTDKRNER